MERRIALHPYGSGFQQHPQAWPCQADLPSWRRKGMATNAAIESNHGRWNAALTARPAKVINAMYAQVADCTASAARAAFLLRRASWRFSDARTGIAISAATVIPIPARLVSGRDRRAKDAKAIAATTKASKNSRTPAARPALGSEIGMPGIHCKSTTAADRSSTRLSEPKASIAGLWDVAAA